MHERTTDAAETAVPLPEPQGRSYTPGASEQGRAMTSVEAGRRAGRPGASREPFGRADRYIVGLLATLLGSTLIGFVTIGGQLLAMERRIGGLHTGMERQIGGLHTDMERQIGGLHTGMERQIGGLHTDMERIRTEVHKEISNLRTEMREEIGELSERMTRIETLIETHFVPASNARDPAGP